MKKMQEHVVEGKRVFVGLEDSKRSWKVCVRSGGMIVQESSLPADYDNLRRYLERGYPGCRIEVMYEAGFGGFWLHDLLVADGVQCVVTPPHTLTEAKVNKVKTDRGDARPATREESGEWGLPGMCGTGSGVAGGSSDSADIESSATADHRDQEPHPQVI